MLKKVKKTAFTLSVMSVTFLCMLTLSLFAVNFSSIFYILISACLGLSIYAITYFKGKSKRANSEAKK